MVLVNCCDTKSLLEVAFGSMPCLIPMDVFATKAYASAQALLPAGSLPVSANVSMSRSSPENPQGE